jgi:hypothetical protein
VPLRHRPARRRRQVRRERQQPRSPHRDRPWMLREQCMHSQTRHVQDEYLFHP